MLGKFCLKGETLCSFAIVQLSQLVIGEAASGDKSSFELLYSILRTDPTPSGLLLTVTVQEEPAGIIETADSLVIDSTSKEFNLTMRGIDAGRATVTLNITAAATDLVDIR